MNQPDFRTLPEVLDNPNYRVVGSTQMDFEEYQTCQFHVAGTYTTDTGETGRYWKATLEGLRRYGELRHSREEAKRAERRYRRESDDQWSEEVERMVSEKP